MMRTITPIFSIILAILIYFFFISPMYADVKEIRIETDEFLNAAKEYDNFNKDLNKILGIKSTPPPLTIERLNQIVPVDIDLAHVIADLEVMAKRQSMLFGDISTETKEAALRSVELGTEVSINEELQTADVSFDLIGTYDQLQDFLIELESSLTIFEVINLEFTASDGLFEQFSMTIRTYSLPAENN